MRLREGETSQVSGQEAVEVTEEQATEVTKEGVDGSQEQERDEAKLTKETDLVGETTQELVQEPVELTEEQVAEVAADKATQLTRLINEILLSPHLFNSGLLMS